MAAQFHGQKTSFYRAQFHGSSRSFFGAQLGSVRLTDVDLSEADLRETSGLTLDSTFIRGARFSPDSKDRWSVIRRWYTGPKFFLHLLILIVFLLPYVVRTVGWLGVNRAQESLVSATRGLDEAASQLRREGHPAAVVVGDALRRLTQIKPCLQADCRQFSVGAVLIGVDRGSRYWLLAVALLVYNLCRGILTFFAGPLRDEEERSGYSPPLKGFNGYGWLWYLHCAVVVLLFLALTSFAYHLWDWLTRPVWLPV
jgi:hypothetical protein